MLHAQRAPRPSTALRRHLLQLLVQQPQVPPGRQLRVLRRRGGGQLRLLRGLARRGSRGVHHARLQARCRLGPALVPSCGHGDGRDAGPLPLPVALRMGGVVCCWHLPLRGGAL
jgi:hypothetical protein